MELSFGFVNYRRTKNFKNILNELYSYNSCIGIRGKNYAYSACLKDDCAPTGFDI